MWKQFQFIISKIIKASNQTEFFLFDPYSQFQENVTDPKKIANSLNSAFLILLAGEAHPLYQKANQFLHSYKNLSEWKDTAEFFMSGISLIKKEIELVTTKNKAFRLSLENLYQWCKESQKIYKRNETAERFWSVFFPEGVGIIGKEKSEIEDLRHKRVVKIERLNPNPISDPTKQMLFTGNVLLTIPGDYQKMGELSFSNQLKTDLTEATKESQIYWYDHPIPIGVKPEKNEIIYGLRGLQQALKVERIRGNASDRDKLICILSASVTHKGLHPVVRQYIQEELQRSDILKDLEVYVFTEVDTQKLIKDVLVPASEKYLGRKNSNEELNVIGVDGEYGRHYSFLKAILALWQIFIDPHKIATFKIDLDQVFPQEELVEETGASAFEHFMSPLWGAKGTDSSRRPVELGMLAGALVNQKDISKSIFTPDVPFPQKELAPDEYIFYSTLPQALSTEAEMMSRYRKGLIDGKNSCIQRIHVTGGTTGILLESLFRFRPFTPSFIGRAEDQAYIFSAWTHHQTQLGYLHKSGLIMRHDKEAFAKEAIEKSAVGKLIGDYIRILYFSRYGEIIQKDFPNLKSIIDPFTGCFISRIPKTVVYLRMALKAASFFERGKMDRGFELLDMSSRRISNAIQFMEDTQNGLEQIYFKEKRGWNLFYNILESVKAAQKSNDSFALEMKRKMQKIINECRI